MDFNYYFSKYDYNLYIFVINYINLFVFIYNKQHKQINIHMIVAMFRSLSNNIELICLWVNSLAVKQRSLKSYS